MQKPVFIQTDTLDDALSSLELSLAFYEQAQSDDRYWKWFLIALHSGVQGSFALALEGTDGMLVQKPVVAARMIASLEAREVPPPPHMDNFLRLYKKLVNAGGKRSTEALSLPQSSEHESALNALDELRDEFLHFNTKSFGVSRDLIK